MLIPHVVVGPAQLHGSWRHKHLHVAAAPCVVWHTVEGDATGYIGAAPAAYGVRGIPAVYVIDQQGKVAATGRPSSIDIPNIVDELLGKVPEIQDAQDSDQGSAPTAATSESLQPLN